MPLSSERGLPHVASVRAGEDLFIGEANRSLADRRVDDLLNDFVFQRGRFATSRQPIPIRPGAELLLRVVDPLPVFPRIK